MTARRPRLYLHIGTPKTGTTFLQDVCWHNRHQLATDGIVYPGAASGSQYHAVMEVLSPRYPQWHDLVIPGSWAALLDEARGCTQDMLLSHELLCPAGPDEVRRILADLDFAEVHLVCTARNLASQIPSVWQEDLKNGHTLGFDEFVEGLRNHVFGRVKMADVFWSFQDLTSVLRTWGEQIPPERVHLLTVPARGGVDGPLWLRFAELLGLHAAAYDTAVSTANRSLGRDEAELVRRVNEALAGRLSNAHYRDVIKFWLASDTLAARDGKTAIRLGPQDYEWSQRKAAEFVEAISADGYHVLGDLDELVPVRRETTEPGAAVVNPERVLDASLDALVSMVDHLVAELDRRSPEPAPGWKGRLVNLSERHDSVMLLRRTYTKLRGRNREPSHRPT